MESLLDKIAHCVEEGKINRYSPYPPEMKDQDGADELTQLAVKQGISPDDILQNGFIRAMDKVGKKFSEHKIFVPQMLMSAKAMSVAMEHLKPFFQSGETERRGVFIIGTVTGDLHEIGKNLAAMMIEGSGWEVINLGKDVRKEKFVQAVHKHPDCVVGLSALLTTTMIHMADTIRALKEEFPQLRIIIGGAPVNQEFCDNAGADFYAADPQAAVVYLKQLS